MGSQEKRGYRAPSPEEIVAALSAFGLEPAGAASFLDGGLDNHNVRVPTGRGDVVARFYNVRSAADACNELALVDWLAAEGYPTPRPFRRATGEHLSHASARPVAVFPFVEGRVPETLTIPLARQLGRTLARLHELTPRYSGRTRAIDRLALLRRAAERDYGLPDQHEWHAAVRRFLIEEESWLAKNLDRFEAAAIHHDLHARNVLVRGDAIVAVLDFDEVNHAPVILDVLSTLHFFATTTPGRHVPLDLGATLFAAYEEVLPLRPLERESLGRLFDFTNLADAASFLSDASARLRSVHDCFSFLTYLANRGGDLRGLLARGG